MDPLLSTLQHLGLGIATNAVYDILKNYAGSREDKKKILNEINNALLINGVNLQASTIIHALSKNGFLSIQESNLHASESVTFGSAEGGEAYFGNNSSMTTDKTGIVAGQGAGIHSKGNAHIKQNPDGSISFFV